MRMIVILKSASPMIQDLQDMTLVAAENVITLRVENVSDLQAEIIPLMSKCERY